MKDKVVIFGTGDIAELAHFYFSHDSKLQVVAFCVDAAFYNVEEFCGLPIVPFEALRDHYPPEEHAFFAALSYASMNQLRAKKVLEAKENGYEIASYVSSKATFFENFSCGENCFILENNTIQPFVKIGDNVTLWSGNHIGRHSTIEDNVFISSHVVVSGGVNVGKNCFVGVNATIHDHLEVADFCLVGAGALVNKNTQANGVYLGAPAKLVRDDSRLLDL